MKYMYNNNNLPCTFKYLLKICCNKGFSSGFCTAPIY